MKLLRMATVFALFVVPGVSFAISVDQAKELFAKYVELERTFDPAVASLYSDSAKISSTRIYPDGRERSLQLPAAQYKALVAQSMPAARVRRDANSYSEVVYILDGERVRVEAVRYSELKNYASPLVLLIGLDESGALHILEEHSVTRP